MALLPLRHALLGSCLWCSALAQRAGLQRPHGCGRGGRRAKHPLRDGAARSLFDRAPRCFQPKPVGLQQRASARRSRLLLKPLQLLPRPQPG